MAALAGSLTGRTVMITGPTSGIGRATARELARADAELVLVCRSREKGEALRGELGCAVRSELLIADFSSQASIRAAAEAWLKRERPLHVLINNAGVVNLERRLTSDGIEETFAVNHLAYFLFTHLLLERLRASAPARIINVASDAHRLGRIRFDDIGFERGYQWMRVYGQSKLANVMFTVDLAERLRGSGVTVNCLHPGAVATGLGKNNGRWADRLIGLLRPFFRTPERGAETTVQLATAIVGEESTGMYFSDCKPAKIATAARDSDARARLWSLSQRLTGVTS